MKDYNKDILNAVCGYLDDNSWKYDLIEEDGIVKLGFGSESKFEYYITYFAINQSTFTFNVVIPANAQEEVRMRTVEFITKVNYHLLLGSFEMDFDDGQLIYKTTHCCEDTVPTKAQINAVMFTSVMTVEKYSDAIIALLSESATVDKAIEMAEQNNG